MTKLKKPPLFATILTLLGITILCTLGWWQLERLAWKNDILAKLDAAYAGKEQIHPLDPAQFHEGTFLYGGAEGAFLADKALLLGPKTKDREIGNDLIVPLKINHGTLLVNMGWTKFPLKDLPIHHLNNKTIRFEGLARAPGWNRFTPDNEPEKDLWFKPDIAEIAAAKNLENPLPYMLYAETASYKFDAAFPNNTRWQPNNNHLQYAFFWFSLAGALIVIFTLRFVVKP